MGVVASVVADKRRILLVDDIELNRTLTEAVLRGATYEVDSVGDGASALAAMEDKRYDLVLMDIEMPGLDGHAAASAIRRREQSAPKLAALSSRSGAAARHRSAEVGMAAHIARPIAPHALLREIERVFCQTAEEAIDPWQRQHYEEWVARLGTERMRGFLAKLHEQFRDLLATVLLGEEAGDALHRQAHDVASTGGMLGFLDVTASCRAVLEGGGDATGTKALSEALRHAILRLDRHFASDGRGGGRRIDSNERFWGDPLCFKPCGAMPRWSPRVSPRPAGSSSRAAGSSRPRWCSA